MQQGGGQYGETTGVVREQSRQLVEAASPISSRPPASAAATGDLDEFMRLASGGNEGAGGEDEGDRSGGGGNRWPRQETLALLKIRSDMDAIFRDAAIKGPLWEDVSRKLAELGYKRSAKKCKEKFENVQKYYKRTKQGRGGRQDGKSYKFFTELEAFHTSPATVTTAVAATDAAPPVSVSIPIHIPPTTTAIPMSSSVPGPMEVPVSAPPPMATPPPPITTTTAAAFEIEFSANSSSSSHGFDEDDIDGDELGGEPSDTGGTSRKRKRHSSRGSGGSSSSSTTKMMMEYLEGLMKQVMHKQKSLQQRFLEALEKREQDRMIREEAWKRQETLRLAREHELMARERAIASSRDDAIMNFLEKIQLPTTTVPTPPPQTQPAAVPVVPPSAPIPAPTSSLNQQQYPQLQHQQSHIPEQHMVLQEIGGSGSLEPASSRWPKEEVLALINLRSGLDLRYQDVGPKGPLWEEISAGMSRMGYKRNAKRCKEKWENINKYYKKVKESSKKRPEDAKTCPYFHQLDALHRRKSLGGGGGGGSSSFGHQNRPEEETSLPQQDISDASLMRQPSIDQSENKTGATVDVSTSKECLSGSLLGEGNGGASRKPGITVRELMEDQGMHLQQHHKGQSLLVDGYDRYDDYHV